MWRVGLLGAVLAGCQADVLCLPVSEVEIADVDGVLEEAALDAVRDRLDAFSASTGRTCLNLESIQVVGVVKIQPGFPKDVPVAGRYSPEHRRIRLARASLDSSPGVLQHELCHALDATEGLTEADPSRWEPPESEVAEGYPDELQVLEYFARRCAAGPSNALDRALRTAWGLAAPDPRQDFLDEVVWVDAPGLDAPPLFDLDIELLRETWLTEGQVLGVAATAEALVVRVAGPDEEQTLHVLALDPLQEVAALPVEPFGADGSWVPWWMWSGSDSVYLGGGGDLPWVRFALDGTVEPTARVGSDLWALVGKGVGLDGVGVGAGIAGGQASVLAVDFTTGERLEAGLPPDVSIWSAWVEGDRMALATGSGVWRGGLDTGWWYDPAPAWGRPVPLDDGRGLGSHGFPTADGWVDVAVATGSDGVDHFPAEPVAALGDRYLLRGRWRLVNPVDGGLEVVTVEP